MKTIGPGGSFSTIFEHQGRVFKVPNQRDSKRTYIENEKTILEKISAEGGHPCIVRYVGYIDSPQYALEFEWLSQDLFALIVELSSKNQLCSFDQIYWMVRDIASGLSFLHERSILHRDLKLENVMLTQDRTRVKLIDFGFAYQLPPEEQVYQPQKLRAGTIGYMAPEVYYLNMYTTASDMYALGLMTFMLAFGFLPFFNYFNSDDVLVQSEGLFMIRQGHREDLSGLMDVGLQRIIHSLWHPIKEERPVAQTIERFVTATMQETPLAQEERAYVDPPRHRRQYPLFVDREDMKIKSP